MPERKISRRLIRTVGVVATVPLLAAVMGLALGATAARADFGDPTRDVQTDRFKSPITGAPSVIVADVEDKHRARDDSFTINGICALTCRRNEDVYRGVCIGNYRRFIRSAPVEKLAANRDKLAARLDKCYKDAHDKRHVCEQETDDNKCLNPGN